MKILSIRQHDAEIANLEAYLSGVLKGDGWCTKYIGLRVADQDFSETFSDAIFRVFGVSARSQHDDRGYCLVKTSNATGKFSYLLEYEPVDVHGKALWIRGLFDSEGNAQIGKCKRGENSYYRRVAMYSTNLKTLERARTYLEALSINSKIRSTKNSASHKGTKTVYELVLKANKENYHLFASGVGSSIGRKQITLDAIVESYHPDLRAAARSAQLKGAATRLKRNQSNETKRQQFLAVVEGVRNLIRLGVKPTQRNCKVIPGYVSVQQFIPQSTLIELAVERMGI